LRWGHAIGHRQGVVAASGGYPGRYASGRVITGLESAPPGVEVFHAGTALSGKAVVTAGGRVLAVSSMGENLQAALDRVYATLSGIAFEGMQYRRDIGWRALGTPTECQEPGTF